MITQFYFLLIIGILAASFQDFYVRKTVKYIDYKLFYLWRMLITSICLGAILYFFDSSNVFKYLYVWNINNYFWAFITILTVFIFILTRYFLLENYETSYIIPIISSSSIILSLIIGYFILNEKIDKYKIIGSTFLLPGIFIFSGSK
ncbi:EamA-like transporter family [seawater metagenome]|uniref:EamA-like transporter family n=1 Tax=seawater metagenome TaxID=1561972 RepID=A0A5E8CLD4_9ZZZZ